jgi:type II secretory pathway pseudopilin PulG
MVKVMTRFKKQYFSMIEIMAIMAVLIVLFAAFSSTLSSVYQANNTFVSESKALLVLGNTIERLKNRDNISIQELKKVFDDEFRRSDLSKNDLYRGTTIKQGKDFLIRIIRVRDKRILAEVKL